MTQKLQALIFACCLTLAATAQTTREEIYADLNKAGGVYLVYPEPATALTPAPKGYTPCYISHYGRHGSRYLIGDNDYLWVTRLMQQAEAHNALTPLGKSVLQRLQQLWPLVEGRGGDLTPAGVRQHQGIAERMYKNYPSLFKKGQKVSARSTVVLRCAMSMAAFGDRLKSLAPGIDISYEATEKYMNYMNYHAPDPENFADWSKGAWVTEYRKFEAEHLKPQRMLKALFSDDTFVRKNVNDIDLMWGLYWIVVDMQNLDTDISFYDVFTKDEMFEMWQCNSYRFYASNANHAGSKGKTVANAANLLRNIVETADSALKDNTTAATLRFGHDGNVMPLLAIMGIENYAVKLDSPEDAYKHWADFKASPMAANIQLIFFKNKQGDVIVKVLHNETEVHIPVNTDIFPFYRWTDVRAYYNSIISRGGMID